MDFRCHSHRFGLELLHQVYPVIEKEIFDVIGSISDEDIIQFHEENKGTGKSISKTLNSLLKAGFEDSGWEAESPIFQDPEYTDATEKRWRLDFAKIPVSMEVAFNHGEAMAWNLLKPVLASELNHVEKAIQTEIGVLILATQDMKNAGGFDSAVGTYEKALRYLKPLQSQISVPLVLIGLNAPATFRVDVTKLNGKNTGVIAKF
jgi:hypothetical protein